MSGARHQWHVDWQLDARAGRAIHGPTGLAVSFVPLASGPPGASSAVDVDDWAAIGQCRLPPTVQDRRKPHQIAAGGPNAAGVVSWTVIAPRAGAGSPPAALAKLLEQHLEHDAREILARISREAGELWIYRARLDRERPRD